MNFSRIFIYAIAGALLACSTPRKTSVPQSSELELAQNHKPSWIRNRPLTESAYVGIGMASKAYEPENFAAVAKKNALEDLASEISISVSANSVLYQLEEDNRFQEQFQQSIRTETAIDLESYRLMGQWEDDSQYWVYYRLDKADYLASIERKRSEAGRLAMKWWELAHEQLLKKARGEALTSLIRGFEELENYLSEEVVVDWQGERVDVGLKLSQAYLDIMRNLQVSLSPERIEMNQIEASSTQRSLRVLVTSADGTPLKSMPLQVIFDRPGIKSLNTFTDGSGLVEILLPTLPNSSLSMQAEVRIDFTQLTEKAPSSPVYQLLKRKSYTVQRVPIAIRAPIFAVACENDFENIFLERISTSILSRSFSAVADASRADAVIHWVGKTDKVRSQNGLSGVQLSGTISVLYEGDILFQNTLAPVMGYGSTHEKAARDAHRQAAEILDHEILRRFFNDLEGY